MAQLTDCCFDAGGALLPLEQAIEHLKENLVPVVERVSRPLVELPESYSGRKYHCQSQCSSS